MRENYQRIEITMIFFAVAVIHNYTGVVPLQISVRLGSCKVFKFDLFEDVNLPD